MTVANDANAIGYDDTDGDEDDSAVSTDGFAGEEFDGSNAYDADAGMAGPALLWFSVAGAVIMGALWVGDALGSIEFFLTDWLTLAVAVVAAIGAALTAYGLSDDDDPSTA